MAIENFSWMLLNTLNQPITSASPAPKILIRRVSDDFIYDWSDSTFKSSGWVTKSQDMTEIDATNFAGVYDASLDVGTFTGYYYAYLVYDNSADVQRIAEEFNVIDGAISNLVHGLTDAESVTLSNVPTNVWGYSE
jgi:hypothetical protein